MIHVFQLSIGLITCLSDHTLICQLIYNLYLINGQGLAASLWVPHDSSGKALSGTAGFNMGSLCSKLHFWWIQDQPYLTRPSKTKTLYRLGSIWKLIIWFFIIRQLIWPCLATLCDVQRTTHFGIYFFSLIPYARLVYVGLWAEK